LGFTSPDDVLHVARYLRCIHDALDEMITACRKSEAECVSCALIDALNSPH